MFKYIFCFVIICLLNSLNCFGQEVKNITAEFDGEKIYVIYDLISSESSVRYDIAIYCSFNNFKTPLKSVSGDVGKLILPGKNKEIIWFLKDELPQDFNDKINFKIKASVSTSQYKIISSSLKKKYKRGGKIEIKWTGGEITDLVNIQLLDKNNKEVIVKNNVLNTGSHILELDKTLKPGAYHIKFNSSFYRSLNLNVDPFKITRRVPLILKIIPFSLAATTGVVVVGASDKDETLPAAPVPTN